MTYMINSSLNLKAIPNASFDLDLYGDTPLIVQTDEEDLNVKRMYLIYLYIWKERKPSK